MAASPLPASPSTAAGRLRRPLALTATALCLGAALAGCQALGGALGGGGGVM
ncbi:zinc ABC transporter substrate-binding protein, partial [Methylobacterium sp. WL119]